MKDDQIVEESESGVNPVKKEVISFFKIWLVCDLLLALIVMSVAKQRGAEFYLLTFVAVLFLAMFPLAITIGSYYFGVARIAKGFVMQGNFYKYLGLVASILVGIYFIKMR